jgi:hypothetical protein
MKCFAQAYRRCYVAPESMRLLCIVARRLLRLVVYGDMVEMTMEPRLRGRSDACAVSI